MTEARAPSRRPRAPPVRVARGKAAARAAIIALRTSSILKDRRLPARYYNGSFARPPPRSVIEKERLHDLETEARRPVVAGPGARDRHLRDPDRAAQEGEDRG